MTSIHDTHRTIRTGIYRAGALLSDALDDAKGTPMPGRDAVLLAAALADVSDLLADLCDQAVRNHALAGHNATPAPGSPLTTAEHFRAAEHCAKETANALYRIQPRQSARAA
jgi:hypothetical protein